MGDVVVTVPRDKWFDWVCEGDLPWDTPRGEFHFWLVGQSPAIEPGSRVYIVAFGRLRGYAPLVRLDSPCLMRPLRRCLVRGGGARAVTIDALITGFRGWRYRWWERAQEIPFPDWVLYDTPLGDLARLRLGMFTQIVTEHERQKAFFGGVS